MARTAPAGAGQRPRILLESLGLRERKNVDLIACPITRMVRYLLRIARVDRTSLKTIARIIGHPLILT